MLYRIFTEHQIQSTDVIRQAMTDHHIDGYTIIEANSCWKRIPKRSLIIEVEWNSALYGRNLIVAIAQQIRQELHQESVMVEKIESETLMVEKMGTVSLYQF